MSQTYRRLYTITDMPPSPQSTYRQLRDAIVEGRLGPGDRLVEQRIAADLGVSRTPVREAIRALAAEGLVVTEVNRGAVVRPLDARDIHDVYEVRARLEGLAAALAAERHRPEDLADLDAGIAAFGAALGGRQRGIARARALSEANRLVHGSIIAAAATPRLAELITHTVDVPLVFQAFQSFEPAQVEVSNLFHGLIRDAISLGEGARADSLMREHVLQGRDVLLAGL